MGEEDNDEGPHQACVGDDPTHPQIEDDPRIVSIVGVTTPRNVPSARPRLLPSKCSRTLHGPASKLDCADRATTSRGKGGPRRARTGYVDDENHATPSACPRGRYHCRGR